MLLSVCHRQTRGHTGLSGRNTPIRRQDPWPYASPPSRKGRKTPERHTDWRSCPCLPMVPSIDKGTYGFDGHKYVHTSLSPLAIRQYALRAFPCLAAFLLRQNCAAPVGDEFLCGFWFLRRRRAGARQAEKDENSRKDTPTGVCALVCRWYGFPGNVNTAEPKCQRSVLRGR